MKEKAKISFIICTYNEKELIKRCLNSILKQDFKEREIIIVDGGSDKETLATIESYKNRFKEIKILHNKKRLPEGYGKGKWLGWKECIGEYVLIIDQDNELQEKDCVSSMIEILDKEDVFGCACRLAIKKQDNLTNRYVALVGTDPFLAYRSIDGVINLKKIGENKGDYVVFEIDKENLIITGGNCFMYRKNYLDRAGGYVQDTENIKKLVEIGYNRLAISGEKTSHLATRGFFDFVNKKKRWAKEYKKDRKAGFSYMPRTRKERRELLINLFFITTIFPNIFISFKKFIETRERAWFLHPILSFITGFIYFFYAFLRFFDFDYL